MLPGCEKYAWKKGGAQEGDRPFLRAETEDNGTAYAGERQTRSAEV
jgi:hypothetical protein